MKCCACKVGDVTGKVKEGNVAFCMCPACLAKYSIPPAVEHVEPQTC